MSPSSTNEIQHKNKAGRPENGHQNLRAQRTESVSDKFSLPGLGPCVTRSTRLEKAWTGQTCSYRGTHAAHNSQLISLQAKQNSESVGQRALIGESVANCVSRPPPQKWQLVKVAIDEPREKTCIAKGIGRRLVMAKARRSAGKRLRLNPYPSKAPSPTA